MRFTNHFPYLAATIALIVPLGTRTQAQCTSDYLFGPPSRVGAALGTEIAVADFNEDGVLDVVATSEYSLFVQLGQGTNSQDAATFSAPLDYAYSWEFRDIEVADFNEDGILDIAFTSYSPSNTLSVLLGNGVGGVGDGTFAPAANYNTGYRAHRMAIADFNEDGILDIAISTDERGIVVLLGNGTGGTGDGTFGTAIFYPTTATGGSGYTCASGDFNDDGILDIAYCEDAGLWVFLGQGVGDVGNGTFTLSGPFTLPHTCTGMSTGDFNDDGILDLLLTGHKTFDGQRYSGISVLLGRGLGSSGDGTFYAGVFVIGDRVIGYRNELATGDFNSDGVTDVAIANDTGQSVSLYLGLQHNGTGNGTFSDAINLGSGGETHGIGTGDFNGDGTMDLVVGPPLSILYGRCLTPSDLGPTITRVRDVPNDQGGRVSVAWLPSVLDNPADHTIDSYLVWRRISPAFALQQGWQVVENPLEAIRSSTPVLLARKSPSGNTVSYWEDMDEIRAQFLEGYGYTAATTQDSLPFKNPYTAFFVSALTEDPFLFFESNVDSGYSVNNLAPSLPKAVRGFLVIDSGDLIVHWHPNPEPDIHHYNVYRGSYPGFEATPANLLASPPDTMYVDRDFGASTFYSVTAVDIHGNESRPPVPVGVGELPGIRTALFQPVDRGGPIRIEFSIGKTSNVGPFFRAF